MSHSGAGDAGHLAHCATACCTWNRRFRVADVLCFQARTWIRPQRTFYGSVSSWPVRLPSRNRPMRCRDTWESVPNDPLADARPERSGPPSRRCGFPNSSACSRCRTPASSRYRRPMQAGWRPPWRSVRTSDRGCWMTRAAARSPQGDGCWAAATLYAPQALASNGLPFDAAAFKAAQAAGKTIIIEITAQWCGPCQRQRPVFAKLLEKPEYSKLMQVGS